MLDTGERLRSSGWRARPLVPHNQSNAPTERRWKAPTPSPRFAAAPNPAAPPPPGISALRPRLAFRQAWWERAKPLSLQPLGLPLVPRSPPWCTSWGVVVPTPPPLPDELRRQVSVSPQGPHDQRRLQDVRAPLCVFPLTRAGERLRLGVLCCAEFSPHLLESGSDTPMFQEEVLVHALRPALTGMEPDPTSTCLKCLPNMHTTRLHLPL